MLVAAEHRGIAAHFAPEWEAAHPGVVSRRQLEIKVHEIAFKDKDPKKRGNSSSRTWRAGNSPPRGGLKRGTSPSGLRNRKACYHYVRGDCREGALCSDEDAEVLCAALAVERLDALCAQLEAPPAGARSLRRPTTNSPP